MAMNGELLITAKLREAKKTRAERRWGGSWLIKENAILREHGQRLHPTKGYRRA